MPVYTDQLNRQVSVTGIPLRIISTVPSQTELLFFIGLGEQIVGITKFCTHPADEAAHIVRVGGTKQLNLETVYQLKPDIIIANKEENERSQMEELAKHYPVWISDVNDLGSALDMIISIGQITDREEVATQLASNIKQAFAALTKPAIALRTAYFIWRKPYMAAGKGTFIDDMLQRSGFENIFTATRYPEITIEELQTVNPEVILLSSEPYPFAEKHIEEFKLILPDAKVLLVDGEMFSWYGSRLLEAAAYFNQLISTLNDSNGI